VILPGILTTYFPLVLEQFSRSAWFITVTTTPPLLPGVPPLRLAKRSVLSPHAAYFRPATVRERMTEIFILE
jgi:hypothetical protein